MKPHLNDLLLDHVYNTAAVLQIGRDRMNFYPGSAFAGLALNAYPQPWCAWASKEPSGSTWFAIHLDAIGIYWEVGYVIWAKRCAFVATPDHRFYWDHGKPGLAWKVLRPLYEDWMLRGALAAEFGPDYLRGLASDPVLLDEYDTHLEVMAALLARYEIEERLQCRNTGRPYQGKNSSCPS
ncbi:hypothetical protein YO5_18162 [Stutzerimonas stutzeri TS44]|nr:hypothetical protein YO5_18162 [Stutzerimonas stutzeri TS44]